MQIANEECGTIALSGEREQIEKDGSLFKNSRFLLKNGGSESITLEDIDASFLGDDLSGHFSPSCKLAWIGALDKGEVYDDSGKVVANHERYYCVFVSLPKACVVAIGTDMMCAGRFDSTDSWVRDDGLPPVNFLSRPTPSAQRYVDNADEREDPLFDLENVIRCDPVSRRNLAAYTKIAKDPSIEISEKSRQNIRKKVDIVRSQTE